jgi:hypothetical protein
LPVRSARAALLSSNAGRTVDVEDPVEDPRELVEDDHVRAVRGGVIRIGVDLEEEAVDVAGRDRGSRERRHLASVAARALAEPAGFLDGVGRVEDDGLLRRARCPNPACRRRGGRSRTRTRAR